MLIEQNMVEKIKRSKKTVDWNGGRLFGKITIESTTIRVEEFDYYTATVKAAEAFSKCILTKSEQDVVDLINKTTGNKFKVSDFTGDVKIGLSRCSEKEIVFYVNFELSAAAKKRQGFLGTVYFTLTSEKKEPNDQKDLSGSKKKSDIHVDFQQTWDFEFQGIKYSVQIK